jgi:UDP-2,3-diacylglucosamine pyrophosphatase LpxH
MKEVRPRLTDEWFSLIDIVKEIGVEEAVRRIETFYTGKVEFDSKNQAIEYKNGRILNAEDLLRVCNVDQEEWFVREKVLNKWEVGAKGPDGKVVVEPLFQVKLWLRRRGFQKPDDHWTQKWLDRLFEDTVVKKWTPIPVTGDTLNIVVADVHLGRLTDESYAIYNQEIVRERLEKIATVANKHSGPVNVFMLGDLIESFTGKNKANTWKQIEMHGAELALSAYDILEDFFASIDRLNCCYFVGGNHDRITDHKEDDDRSQVLEIIHGVFQRKGRFKTIYDPTLLSVVVDDVCYILTHGDKKISKVKGSELVLRFGRPDLYNCILSAHLHTTQIVEEGDTFTKRVVPPIASSSDYEYTSGWTSSPGFITLKKYDERIQITQFPL